MDIILRLLTNVLEEGLIYSIMAIGVFITYSVLHFPDLSVDGTLPLGACVTAALIDAGKQTAVGAHPVIFAGINVSSPLVTSLLSLASHPVAALCVSFLFGCLAGAVTGFLHVKLRISDLLSGILTMTGLWSVNLLILGGRSVMPFYDAPTVFNSGLARLLPGGLYARRVLIMLAVIVLVVKLIVDLYYRTKSGLLLRATGDNDQFVTSQAVDPGRMKVLGLVIGNGLTALSGGILAQQAESANVSGGTGMVVMGLASVIIGSSLLGGVRFLKPTTAVLFGSVVYKAALMIAMQLGLPTNFLKLLMTALFVVALVSGKTLDGRRERHAAKVGQA